MKREDDEKITHVTIDQPIPAVSVPSTTPEELHRTRKYVQPQWVVDSINAQRTLTEGPYTQGQTLPPHLGPFGEEVHAYAPETGDLYTTDLTGASLLDREEEELEADSDVSARKTQRRHNK
jgi:pescadillo